MFLYQQVSLNVRTFLSISTSVKRKVSHVLSIFILSLDVAIIDYFVHYICLADRKITDDCEEAPVFIGQRLKNKMQVYSGSKMTYLPSMMTLYQQCIRALQNNIDCTLPDVMILMFARGELSLVLKTVAVSQLSMRSEGCRLKYWSQCWSAAHLSSFCGSRSIIL